MSDFGRSKKSRLGGRSAQQRLRMLGIGESEPQKRTQETTTEEDDKLLAKPLLSEQEIQKPLIIDQKPFNLDIAGRTGKNLENKDSVRPLAVSRPDDVLDQKLAATMLRKWLAIHAKKPLRGAFHKMCFVLYGPIGIGKSTLAELCIKESGLNLIRYPSHVLKEKTADSTVKSEGATVHTKTKYTWESLEEFIRKNTHLSLTSKRHCLLLDDFKEDSAITLKKCLKLNLPFPVVCTTEFMSRRELAMLDRNTSSVENYCKMLRPTGDSYKTWVRTRLATHFGLNNWKQSWILNHSNTDIRQACNMACLLQGVKADIHKSIIRDYALPPYDWAAAVLGKKNIRTSVPLSMQSVPLGLLTVYENFTNIHEVDLEACASFHETYLYAKIYETSMYLENDADIEGLRENSAWIISKAASLYRGKHKLENDILHSSTYSYHQKKEDTFETIRDIKRRQNLVNNTLGQCGAWKKARIAEAVYEHNNSSGILSKHIQNIIDMDDQMLEQNCINNYNHELANLNGLDLLEDVENDLQDVKIKFVKTTCEANQHMNKLLGFV